jgi:hypothetical protein
MYVGVIRGDLPGPVFLADLEPTSGTNFSTEPPGQTRYIARPNLANITKYLAAQSLVASASGLITATNPIGGPLNVSSAAITAVSGLGSATATQVTALQGMLAAHFTETDVAIKSFALGNLSKYLEATFTPDSTRRPALAQSAAIAVVQDDGMTAFTFAVPNITAATLSGGILTILGTGLGNSEYYDTTTVDIFGPALSGPTASYKLSQKAILHATGGIISATEIVIPASLIPAAVTGSTVRVKFSTLASNSHSF